MQNQNPISWQAHEFPNYPKSAGWYVILTLLTVAGMAFFIFFERDIFAAVSLGLIAVLVILFSRQNPQRVNIELNEKGIRFGQLSYPYKELKFFWVVTSDGHKTINLHTTAFLNNIVILELEDQDPEAARQYLLRHIPEHAETEPTQIQKIMHKFKF